MDCRRQSTEQLFQPLTDVELAAGTIYFGVEIPNTQAARSLAQSIMTLGGTAENYCSDGTENVEETRQPYLQAGEIVMAYVGEIRHFLTTMLPPRWLEFNGGTYDEVDYPELFAALPSDVKSGSTFTLPVMTEAFLTHRNVIDSGRGVRIGSNTQTLSIANLPPHNHAYTSASLIAGPVLQTGPGGTVVGNPTVTGSTGSGAGFNILSARVPVTMAIYAGAG